MKKVYLYTNYERFWHWTQALLIILLALTGFEIHGSYKLFGYELAAEIHLNSAWTLIGLTLLTWFWGGVTGEWRQFNPFSPSLRYMKQQIRYYTKGIFHNEEHPTYKTKYSKFNPLQRLTYFGLVFIIIPLMIITGLMYAYYYSSWNSEFIHISSLSTIAYTHVFIAFFLVAFLVGHIYLTTTGYKPLSSIKAMISGWEEMGDKEAEYAIKEGFTVRIKEQEKEISDTLSSQVKNILLEALKDVEGEFGISKEDDIKTIIQKVHIGYFKLDKEGNYVEVSKWWLDLFKFSYDEVIGKHATFYMSESEKKKVLEYLNNVVHNGETITNVKLHRTCKEGTIVHYNLTASPLYDKEGNIIGAEGFVFESAEQKNNN